MTKVKSKTPSKEIKRQLDKIYNPPEEHDNDTNNLLSDFASTEHGFSVQRILPSDYKTRIKYSEKYNAIDEFDDDLFDEQVAFETRRQNAKPKFTHQLTMTEMDELSDEDYIQYHLYLIDLKKEEDAKAKSNEAPSV